MTYKSEQAAIEARFQANYTETPVKYDNVDYKPTPGISWVELEVHTGDQMPISTGGPGDVLYRNTGIISIQVRTALNIGTQTGKNIADICAAVFRGQNFSSITCYGASITRLGMDDEWFLHNVSIPYFRDEAF
jgi:hypothetical protein